MAKQAAQLKVDDVVDIFQDPITRNKFEGRASLVKKIKVRSTSPRVEDWEVNFIMEPGGTFRRSIMVF